MKIIRVLSPAKLARLAVAVLLLRCASGTAQAATITAWNFENDPVAVNNAPAPSTGTGTASAVGMGVYATPAVGVTTCDVVAGASADTGANGTANLTLIWRVRAQSGGNGWSSAAPIGAQGAQFAASTAGYNTISVSFDWYVTTQGEANLQLQYTTDGNTWNNAAISVGGNASLGLTALSNSSSLNTVKGWYVSDNKLSNGAKAGQDWFTNLTAAISDPAAANNPNFAIRLVNASTGADCVSSQGTALNNSSGNWRLDNVVISGTTGAVKATPSFTGLTASQSLLTNTSRLNLAGKLSAAGPLYPTNTEYVVVSINGLSQTNTFTDGAGDFACTFPIATLPAGTYPITYAYAGDGALNAAADTSTVLTLTNFSATPLVSLTAPAGNAAFSSGTTITLTASAAESGGAITNVAFFKGTATLGNASAVPYSATWTAVPAGNYALTAVAWDALGVAATSAVVNITVTNLPASAVLPPIQTVFVIAMENHNWTQPTPGSSPQQVFGNPAAPYVNSLVTPGNANAAQVAYCTRYFNAGVGVHGSEPNYIWAEAGTDFGVHTDSDPGAGNTFSAPHFTAQLNAAGIPWRNYQEDVQYSSGPTHSASGSGVPVNPYHGSTQYDYGVKHNPMAFFSDTQLQNVFALTNFPTHLANGLLGRYNWITPDEFNNMHSALSSGFTYHGTVYTGDQAAVAQGDNFLSRIVPLIMASAAYQNNGLIVIWWDETEGGDSTGQTIGEILISPLAKGNAYASALEYSHSADVKTFEELFGLPDLANSIPASETRAAGSGYNNVATVNDFADLLVSVPAIRVQQPAGVMLVNGSATVDFGSVIVGSNTAVRTFVVTNAGAASLTLKGMAVGGTNPADFSINSGALPITVNAGGSTTFQVAFTPAANSIRAATLQITNNDASASPFVVNLTGQGSVVAPTVFSGSIATSGTGGFNLTFTVGANQSYRIVAADRLDTPLSNWTQIVTGLALTNPVMFADTNHFSQRFYRVVTP